MGVEIREARPDEYAETGALVADAYREYFGTEEQSHSYLDKIADVAERAARTTILVAVDGERIVGSVTLEVDGRTSDEAGPLEPDEAHIRMLGVSADARRSGVGKALMTECERRALEAGRTRMTLHTTVRMRAARAMYESLGYVRTNDRVLPDGFVLLGYVKQLA